MLLFPNVRRLLTRGVVGFGLTCAGGALAKGDEPARMLPFPDEAHSAELLSRSIMALYQGAGKLLAMPEGKGFAVVTSFDPGGTTTEKVFGSLTGMQRLTVVKEDLPSPNWRGIDLLPDRALFFDGAALAWTESDPKSLTEILRRSVPWDTIRPPRDPRGEPTAPETKALQATFKRAWTQALDLKASGIARLPPSWVKAGTKRVYAVALRLKGFPLALMECNEAEPSLCQLTRQCYVEGASDLTPGAVTGVAVSHKRKLILIGDQKNHMIHVLRFDSCYHLPRVKRMALPDRLKALNNLFVDEDDRLWVSTAAPDDYNNASAYYWSSAMW